MGADDHFDRRMSIGLFSVHTITVYKLGDELVMLYEKNISFMT